MDDSIEFKWKRPISSKFPKIWHTFTAKDVDSEELVEYRIEDLSVDKSEEVLKLLVQYFCGGEPLCIALEVANDPVAETDLVKWYWEPVIQQKMGLVCYKTGSDEIVGVNMNFVACKDDHFYDDMQRHFKSEKNHRQFATLGLLNENFDSCKHYGVDKYLSSAGLVVIPECRGRGIGEQFLKCRESICKEFGIKLTSTSFTSEFSNRVADRAGFKVDVVLSYDEIRTKHPELRLPEMSSNEMTLKSMHF